MALGHIGARVLAQIKRVIGQFPKITAEETSHDTNTLPLSATTLIQTRGACTLSAFVTAAGAPPFEQVWLAY